MMRWRRRFRGRRCPPVRRRRTNRVTGSAPGAASRGDGGPAGGATRPARTVAADVTTLVRRAASDGAPLLRPRLLPADAEPPAGPLFPCPRRPGRSRHCRDAGAPARRAVGGVADAGRHPASRDGRRVPGDRGAEWRERLPRHPRRRGVAFRERPGGPRGLRRAARRAGASWRGRWARWRPSRPARGASRPAAERGGRRGVLHGPPEAPGGPRAVRLHSCLIRRTGKDVCDGCVTLCALPDVVVLEPAGSGRFCTHLCTRCGKGLPDVPQTGTLVWGTCYNGRQCLIRQPAGPGAGVS